MEIHRQAYRYRIPGLYDKTRVYYAYVNYRQLRFIDSTYARAKLRGAVELTGEVILDFTKEDVGLHCIRSSGALILISMPVLMFPKGFPIQGLRYTLLAGR